MSNGQLKCCGSPLFLKSKYGNSYNLTIISKRKYNLRSLKVFRLVQSLFPESKIISIINFEISIFIISPDMKKFLRLLEILERQKNELDIDHFGINGTTLEQVFLK